MNRTTRFAATVSASFLLAFGAGHARVVDYEFAKSEEFVRADGVPVKQGADFYAVVEPVRIDVDLRSLPSVDPWQPGDPIRVIPRRRSTPEIENPVPVNPTTRSTELLDRQAAIGGRGPIDGFTTPLVNVEGLRTGSNPHDPNGEVGPDYFVQAVNGPGGTRYTFHDKTDGSIAAGPFTLAQLIPGGSGTPCDGGLGDPIMLYDELAGRWVFTEFSSSGNRMCVYVAQSNDPISGGWFAYDFTAPSFPDYPKYGVWPDAYYVGTNEASSTLYAFDRVNMLAGNPATQLRFTITDPGAFGFAMIPPVDHDGLAAPPAGAPGLFIRHFDDEAHTPGNNDPSDFLEIWEFDTDFANPANASITGPIRIEISDFDSEQCGFTAFACFPQPNTSTTLDPLREVVMNLPKYRNFGSHESIVGNLTTDVSGADQGGVRWFELRRTGGAAGSWTLHQEGDFAPDIPGGSVDHRWMAASAIDESGNIAIGFNLSNDTDIFPSLTYSGRNAGAPLGTLDQPETFIVQGSGNHTSSTRWGDYSSMSVDPADGCTFWFTSNYGNSQTQPTASTRIASFKFDACGDPTFLLGADNLEQQACVADGADPLDPITVTVASANGFTNTVSLAFNPSLPAGFTGMLSPTSVLPSDPPATSTATITAGAATAPGDYTLTIEGTAAGTDPKTLDVLVSVADATPTVSNLIAPADGALNVSESPLFSWDTSAQASDYLLEIATDPGFSSIVLSQTVTGTSFQPSSPLPTSTQLFWRVTPSNQCGAAEASPTFTFTTISAPGDCGPGTVPEFYFTDDMESGTNGWTTAAGSGFLIDTWDQDGTDGNSGSNSWRGLNVDEEGDQQLISPPVVVPAGVSPLTLQYYGKRDIEANGATACYDGGVLEYSIDSGANWIPVDDARLQTNGYTGPLDNRFGNPLGDRDAWCGSQDWTRTVVDLTGLEGETLQFRFRLATDSSVAVDDWHIDDVRVQSCIVVQEEIFADGFETPPVTR